MNDPKVMNDVRFVYAPHSEREKILLACIEESQKQGRAWEWVAARRGAQIDELQAVAEAAQKVAQAFTAEAEDWNDGEYALWQKDDLILALANLRVALGKLK